MCSVLKFFLHHYNIPNLKLFNKIGNLSPKLVNDIMRKINFNRHYYHSGAYQIKDYTNVIQSIGV